MREHKDKILIENCGHDHLADFRAHSSTEIFSRDDQCIKTTDGEGYFLGKMLNPSITPTRGSQPGYTTMMYDSETDFITNIEMTFLQLESAYMLSQTATKDDFQYLTVNYE